jgi:hypothetical protein
MKTAADWIKQVEAELDAGFTSKAAKKDSMGRLRYAFDATKNICKQAVYAFEEETDSRVDGSFDIICKDLHHFKPAHIEFFKGFAGTEAAAATLHTILEIRDQIKAAEIGVKVKTEEQIIAEFEALMASAVKDDGFRTNNNANYNLVDCENELGTQWTRVDWYVKGHRTAFAEASALISADYKVWQSKGAPSMKGWDFLEIKEFYKN